MSRLVAHVLGAALLVPALSLAEPAERPATLPPVRTSDAPASNGSPEPSEDAHPIHFESRAGCGDTSTFVRAFERRTGTIRLYPGPESSAVRVELEPKDDHTRASLTIRLEDGRVVERSLEALDCREALEAIAFVTALALDPEDVRVARAPAAQAPSEPPSVPDDFADPAPVPPARAEVASVWTLGVLGSGVVGPAPELLGGGEVELAFRTNESGAWVPGVRLGVGFWSRSVSVQGEGTARFDRRYGSLDLCPLEAVSGVLTLRFCAQGTAGALIAEGTETYKPQKSVRPWVDLGWAIWPEIALGERLSWTTRLAVGIPLFRDTYQFDQRTFYEVPWVVGSLGTGINIRFP